MSRTYSEKFDYRCSSDHAQGRPCSGHKLWLEFDRSSDTVTVFVDGVIEVTMDDGMYAALKKAMKE